MTAGHAMLIDRCPAVTTGRPGAAGGVTVGVLGGAGGMISGNVVIGV